MRRFVRMYAGIGILGMIGACEKVIHPDLKNPESRLVIEADFVSGTDSCKVKISESAAFGDNGGIHTIDGAVVTLSDELGNSVQLNADGQGNYWSVSLPAITGRLYTLQVACAGKTYSAQSAMPATVVADTVWHSVQIANGKTRRFINPVYEDPASELNFYRFCVRINGKRSDKIFVRSDQFTNGMKVSQPLGPFIDTMQPGDTVTVELQSVTASVFDYFTGLVQALDGNAAVPSNPPSNFSGGCLGYFNTHGSSFVQLIIPD